MTGVQTCALPIWQRAGVGALQAAQDVGFALGPEYWCRKWGTCCCGAVRSLRSIIGAFGSANLLGNFRTRVEKLQQLIVEAVDFKTQFVEIAHTATFSCTCSNSRMKRTSAWTPSIGMAL